MKTWVRALSCTIYLGAQGACLEGGFDAEAGSTSSATDASDPAAPALECTVVDGSMTCAASGLEEGYYVALNVDLLDCGGFNYGINGISDGTVGGDGSITFVVDLAHMQRFDSGPLPADCFGLHVVSVAYADGIAVVTTQVWLSLETAQGIDCIVADGSLTCTASGLETGSYVALNADLQDCGGFNYGINGISDGTVQANGTVTFVVDLRQMERFDFGPLPEECFGARSLSVAYADGAAVAATTVSLTTY